MKATIAIFASKNNPSAGVITFVKSSPSNTNFHIFLDWKIYLPRQYRAEQLK
jgi:hypothetical protein